MIERRCVDRKNERRAGTLFTITSLIEICHINNGLVRISFLSLSLENIIFLLSIIIIFIFFAACRRPFSLQFYGFS